MASLNKCAFIGNVGKIDTQVMTSGESVVNFSLACNEKWKSKDGEKQEKVEWINCVAYRKLAEIMHNYVKVGHQIYCEGKMQTRKWQTKDGQDRYSTEIIVNEMTILGSKHDGIATADSYAMVDQPIRPRHEPVIPRPEPSAQQPRKKSSFNDNFDDDIPFN